MESLNEREQLFVVLGAAIGSNCVPCVEKILPKAKAAGIENRELRLALNVADHVRQRVLFGVDHPDGFIQRLHRLPSLPRDFAKLRFQGLRHCGVFHHEVRKEGNLG